MVNLVTMMLLASLMFSVLVLVSTGTGVTDVADVFSFNCCQPAVDILAKVAVIGIPPFYGSLLLPATLLAIPGYPHNFLSV